MSKSHLEDIEESLKKFLIIGENLDDIYSYHQINYLNIFIFIILLSSFFFSLIFVISIGSIWYFLSVSFLG
ncbi:MAG: hypothetical protein OEY49_11445, partial [Candidatus Heimdallarchaeota archaeon]|nr:hypothetical protein [Candidatus Heimdallarchaeota archaeon]